MLKVSPATATPMTIVQCLQASERYSLPYSQLSSAIQRLFERQVPAGHFLLFRQSGYIKVESYWDLSYATTNAPPPSSIEEIIENIRTLLIDAVRLRLRSDVPLAMYLSGGIDSAAVAGIASMLLREKDHKAKLTAFTLAFPGEDVHISLLGNLLNGGLNSCWK